MSEDPATPKNAASFSAAPEVAGGSPAGDRAPGGDGQPRPHRRRRRRRRRGGRPGGAPGSNGAPDRVEEAAASGPERAVEGVLYLPPRESAPGVLVTAAANFLPTPKDPIVPRELIRREGLEAGALVAGFAVDGSRPVVRRIETVEGLTPEAFRQRPAFADLISIDPNSWLKLETDSDEMCGRVVDLLAPI
ncbi:MAG: hypothetical protein ABI610_13380 [Acidobacteriota bacterium]